MEEKKFIHTVFDFKGKATAKEFRTYFWNPIIFNAVIYFAFELLFASSTANIIKPLITMPIILVSVAALFRRNRALGYEINRFSTVLDPEDSKSDKNEHLN